MGTAHVWIKYSLGPPVQGLVLAWRQVVHQASPVTWEALVVRVDERDGSARAEWLSAMYLRPVHSVMPGFGNSESGPAAPGGVAAGP
jgi:hypothetical protein